MYRCFNDFLFLDPFPMDHTISALEIGEPHKQQGKNQGSKKDKPNTVIGFSPLVPEKY
jgi:hypothetical protein